MASVIRKNIHGSDFNKNRQQTYENIWKKDASRLALIKDNYAVDIRVIWESDATDNDKLNEVINWIYN